MRIVSLLPSATEILFAVGAGAHVVGVTFECDHPPEARRRRIVSTSALPEGLPPAAIDELVSRRMAAGEDLYHLDRGALAGLDADLVVTQDLCAVCAVDVTEVEDALAYLGCRAAVLTLDPQSLGQVLDSIVTLGEATGSGRPARELVASLRHRLATVEGRVRGREPVPAVILEWTDPPYEPGHWVPEMVTAAGGECLLGAPGRRSARTTWERVREARPAVVVCAPCGFALPRSAELAGAALAAGVLPAGVPVWAVDANASFARPGPRLVDGVEALAAILHPEAFGDPDSSLARRLA